MEHYKTDALKYQIAEKRVKQLKGFYMHLVIFIVINIIVFVANYRSLPDGSGFLYWQLFSTPLFWGIGLLAHAGNVFMPHFILGKDWEERKIKDLMNKK